MKFVQFIGGGSVRLGIKIEKGIIDVEQCATLLSMDVPTTMEQVIVGGDKALLQLKQLTMKEVPYVSEEEMVYAPCITQPEKIICVGLNYIDHAKESNMEIPSSPVLFSKFNNALSAHKQEIDLPKNAEHFDYEAELIIVIGKEASGVSKRGCLIICVWLYSWK